MRGMAEVIADALAEWPAEDSAEEHAVRVAAALTAAGFGPVKEAGVEALEEAADLVRASEWWADEVTNEHGNTAHSVRTWLRTRAAAVRGEG